MCRFNGTSLLLLLGLCTSITSTDPMYSPNRIAAFAARLRRCNNLENLSYEFPWTVQIFGEDLNAIIPEIVQWCKGSIIHPNVILTVAECVYRKSDSSYLWTVGAEISNVTQYRPVSQVIVHPYFDPETIAYNFAILILDKPFKLTSQNIVPLPTEADWIENNCFGPSWQQFRHFMKPHSCQDYLYQMRIREHVHPTIFCVSYEDRVTYPCRYKYGSALMCRVKDSPEQYVQAGMFTYGNKPFKYVRVYASIFHALNWIDNTLAENDLEREFNNKNNSKSRTITNS